MLSVTDSYHKWSGDDWKLVIYSSDVRALGVQSRHLQERIEPESFRLFCPDLADELVGCDSLTDFRLILLCCVPQHQCPLVQWKPEYPTATQQERNTMTETVTIDRPSVAKPVSRPRSRKPATVNASALALHLDCSRTTSVRTKAMPVILTTDEEHDVWMRRGMRRRSYSGRCRMMR